MKKLMAILVAAVMTVSMVCTAFAAGNFVTSPSDPVTNVKVTVDKDNIVVTPYSERKDAKADNASVADAIEKDLEAAAAAAESASSVSALASTLPAAAEKAGFKAADLKIASLLDIATKDGSSVDTVKISFAVPSNFVAVLHFTDGAWVLEADATAVKDGVVSFEVGSLSPFAVVVGAPAQAGGTAPTSPQTGEAMPFAYMSMALLFAAAAIVVTYKGKKSAK